VRRGLISNLPARAASHQDAVGPNGRERTG